MRLKTLLMMAILTIGFSSFAMDHMIMVDGGLKEFKLGDTIEINLFEKKNDEKFIVKAIVQSQDKTRSKRHNSLQYEGGGDCFGVIHEDDPFFNKPVAYQLTPEEVRRECEDHLRLVPSSAQQIWYIAEQGPIKKQIRLVLKITDIIQGDRDVYQRFQQKLIDGEYPGEADHEYFRSNLAFRHVNMKIGEVKIWATQHNADGPFMLRRAKLCPAQ